MSIFTHTHNTYIYTYIHIYIYMSIYLIHIILYIYIHTHTHTHTLIYSLSTKCRLHGGEKDGHTREAGVSTRTHIRGQTKEGGERNTEKELLGREGEGCHALVARQTEEGGERNTETELLHDISESLAQNSTHLDPLVTRKILRCVCVYVHVRRTHARLRPHTITHTKCACIEKSVCMQTENFSKFLYLYKYISIHQEI